jgi:peptide/nickel transport system substrate-binding protein
MHSTRRTILRLLAGTAVVPLAAGWAGATAQGRDLNVALAFEPSAMDPHFHNTTPNKGLVRQVFEPLVFQDEQQRVIPGLATRWRAETDTMWRLDLRRDVVWHDGSPFTADDVLFTLERAANVPNSPSGFGGFIRGKTAEKIDDHTIVIRTAEPQPQLPIDLSTFGIVSAKHGRGATTQDYNDGKAAIGTGPFRFVEFVKGDRIVVEGFDRHWSGPAAWRRVTFRTIRSDPSRVAALLAGNTDLIEFVPPADVARLKADQRFRVVSGPSNRVMYVAMDQFRDDSPFIKAKDGGAIRNPLRDVRVRRALSLAINRQAIVERVMEGEGAPAGQFMPDIFFGTSPHLPAPAFDLAGARRLLAEAGLANGFRMTVHGPINRYTNDTKILEALAQMWTRLGVETQVETLPPAAFFARGSTGGAGGTPEFSIFLAGWGAASGEASDGMRALTATFDRQSGLGASNRGRYSNPAFDQALAQALSTIDDEKRAGALARAGEIAIEDVAIIPVIYFNNTWAMRSTITMSPRTDEYTLAMSVKPA